MANAKKYDPFTVNFERINVTTRHNFSGQVYSYNGLYHLTLKKYLETV